MSRQVSNNLFYENELPLVNGLGGGMRRHSGLAYRRPIGQHDNMTTIVLLTISNVFMTFALYGHLKYPEHASAEGDLRQLAHCINGVLFSGASEPDRFLRIHDGAAEDHSGSVTLTVFSVLSIMYLKESLKWNYVVGFAMMVGGVFVIFKKW